MKNFTWYAIIPVLLLIYHLAGAYFIAYPIDETQDAYPLYSTGMYMTSMFLYMILNALIAYIVYTYKESTGLLVVHVVYVGYILLMINATPDSPMYLLSELIQLILDVMALIYATQVVNKKLKFWFKLFTITVLVETLIAIFIPIFLQGVWMQILNTVLSLAVTGILLMFFLDLKNIGMHNDDSDRKEPGDLLSRDDWQ